MGDLLTITASLGSGGALPAFIIQEGVTLSISPSLAEEAGEYSIELKVEDNDSVGSGSVLSEETSFTLTVVASSLGSTTSADEVFPDLEEFFISTESS